MTRACLALLALLFASVAFAQPQGTQMPDVRQMSGVPLPVADLPNGTISVRVIRGSLSNNITKHPVQLIAGAQTKTVITDDHGRAQFDGVAAGTEVRVVAVVDGERIESQAIQAPARGGVRVMLVAGDPELAKRAADDARMAAAPPQPGIVVLGGESRIVVELADEAIDVYYLLEIVNTARTPVQTAGPLIFDMPTGARSTTVMQDSTAQATASGARVTVTGPFPPGRTTLQTVYQLPYRGGGVQLAQTLPAPLERVTVAVEKRGDIRLSSTQLAEQRDVNVDSNSYIFATGPALAAGRTIELSLTGLPHRAAWPRYTALSLAALIVLIGAWLSWRGRAVPDAPAGRKRLEARRDRLFDELTTLEEERRTQRIGDDAYADRRRRLIADLERIYAAMDEAA